MLFLDNSYVAFTGYNGRGYFYVWDGGMAIFPPVERITDI
jgi:hypothetical protein